MTINAEQSWMLLLFVAANFAFAALGSRLGERDRGSEVWFESLIKPPGFPSSNFFSQVWSLVAIGTGVGGWLIWRYVAAGGGYTALVLYGFQLMLLATWQGETIGLRRLQWGLTVGWVLFAVVTLTILAALPAPDWAWVWLMPLWLLLVHGLRLNAELARLNPPPSPPLGATPGPPSPELTSPEPSQEDPASPPAP